MAKNKTTVNKTQLIKDYLAKKPDEAPKVVAAALTEQGYNVTANYVSTIKTNMRAKTKKRGRKKAAPKKGAATQKRTAADQISLSALLEAKKLAAKLGGIEQAKQAVAAWAQLND